MTNLLLGSFVDSCVKAVHDQAPPEFQKSHYHLLRCPSVADASYSGHAIAEDFHALVEMAGAAPRRFVSVFHIASVCLLLELLAFRTDCLQPVASWAMRLNSSTWASVYVPLLRDYALFIL